MSELFTSELLKPLLRPVTRAAFRLWKHGLPGRLRDGVRTLMARDQPGRDLEVHPDDTFLVSYPKSGNTWLRFLVAHLLDPTPADFPAMEARVPSIYKATRQQLAALPRPRVLKSHEYFDPRYRRVLLVVRDPRDVLVSYYHYSLRKGFIEPSRTIDAFGDDFFEGRLDRFGTWFQNVASWLGARSGTPDFLVVRFEDLRRDCVRELGPIAELLGRPGADLTRVAAASSFERMRALERAADGATVHLTRKRADVPFVRQGTAGGWRTELPERLARAMATEWAPLMTRFGYS